MVITAISAKKASKRAFAEGIFTLLLVLFVPQTISKIRPGWMIWHGRSRKC